jgi:CRP-like cAMP-binding protein
MFGQEAKIFFVNFITGVLPMPVEKAREIASAFSPVELEKGVQILSPGQVCNHFNFTVDGLVRAFTVDHDGNEVTTGFYGSGQVVCDLLSFFKRLPTTETYVTLDQVQAFQITFDQVQKLFHGMPEFREFGRMMLINAYAGLKQAMLSQLHKTADERYLQLLKMQPEIFKYAALKDVASFLGITDSSLSRIRREIVGR